MQFIKQFRTFQKFVQSAVVRSLENLSQISIVEFFDTHIVQAQHLLKGNLRLQDVIDASLESRAGLRVHADDDAILVVSHRIDHRGFEDRLIAQHGVLDLLLAVLLVSDVAHGSNQNLRLAIPIAMQHRNLSRVMPMSHRRIWSGLNLKSDLLLPSIGHFLHGFAHTLIILRYQGLEKHERRDALSLHISVNIETGDGLVFQHIEEDAHMTGLQNKRKPVVALSDVLGHPLLISVIEQVIAQQEQRQQKHSDDSRPNPCRYTGLRPFRIEPLVLDGLQTSRCIQTGVDAVHLVKQVEVVHHEFVFSVRHVDGLQFQIIVLELMEKPLQTDGVPHDAIIGIVMDKLYGFAHVVVGNGIVAPSALHHEHVTETASMDNDAIVGQILVGIDNPGVFLSAEHAMGENLNHRLAVGGIIVVQMVLHTNLQVATARLQILQRHLGRFQLNDVRDIEFLENHLQQIDIETHGLAIFVQKNIGPQVPGIFVDKRMFLGVYPDGIVFFSRKRQAGACEKPKHQEHARQPPGSH